jgi:hypothetical protein
MRMGEQMGEGLIVGMHSMQAAVQAAAMDMVPIGALSHSGGMATQALGDMSLRASLDVTGTLPRPANAFAAARDADWQQMLRESLLVARASGFKG